MFPLLNDETRGLYGKVARKANLISFDMRWITEVTHPSVHIKCLHHIFVYWN